MRTSGANEQRDAVKEARALLTKVAPSGKITNGADAYLFDMRGPSLLKTLCDEVDRLRKDNSDLVAANLSTLLSEIKDRLTPEEGEQFQALLLSATRGWVDDVTERTKVNRGVLEAFKGHPKRKKKYDA